MIDMTLQDALTEVKRYYEAGNTDARMRRAWTVIRNAVASGELIPRADARVRQNLALAVGLQGRFDEASRIASEDLPPDQAQANVAYLRAMLSQPNTWKQLKQADKSAKQG